MDKIHLALFVHFLNLKEVYEEYVSNTEKSIGFPVNTIHENLIFHKVLPENYLSTAFKFNEFDFIKWLQIENEWLTYLLEHDKGYILAAEKREQYDKIKIFFQIKEKSSNG